MKLQFPNLKIYCANEFTDVSHSLSKNDSKIIDCAWGHMKKLLYKIYKL